MASARKPAAAAKAHAPRRGRPPLGDRAMSQVITLRLTHATHAQLEELAARRGLTIVDAVREAIELAIARGSTR